MASLKMILVLLSTHSPDVKTRQRIWQTGKIHVYVSMCTVCLDKTFFAQSINIYVGYMQANFGTPGIKYKPK